MLEPKTIFAFSMLTLVFAGMTGACTDNPQGTGGNGGTGGNAGSGGAPEGTFANVQAIFDVHCTNCHDAQKVGIPNYPSLSLVSADAYAALVNKAADQACGGTRVGPGAQEQIFLLQKIEPGVTPCFGQHMPRPFEIGPELNLSSAELETIRSWIAAGAQP